MCTLWRTLQFQQFQKSSSRHITQNNLSRAAKGIINATVVLKATMVSKNTVATMVSELILATMVSKITDNKAIQGPCCNNVIKTRQTDMVGHIICSSIMLKNKEHIKMYTTAVLTWKENCNKITVLRL
jgi:hypothetical protein